MKKKSHIRIRKVAGLTGLLAAIFLAAPQVFAANIQVNNILDVAVANQCSIREAITASNTQQIIGGCQAGNGNDTILLIVGGTYQINSPLPKIGTPQLTIIGQSALSTRIDGQNQFRIFDISQNSSLKIQNLRLQHAHDSAIFNNGGNLEISKMIFSNNAVGDFTNGGAIDNQGTLKVSDSTFLDNTAFRKEINAGSGAGGAIYNYDQPMLIKNSTFSGNSSDIIGGAIMSTAPVTIIDSTFTNNFVPNKIYSANGGAIYLQYEGADSLISSSTFYHNSAYWGGAVGNEANLVIVNSTFHKNEAGDRGGAIFNDGPFADGSSSGNLSIFNSTFSDNTTLFNVGKNNRGDQIYRGLGVINIANTIITSSLEISENCLGFMVDGGNNLEYSKSGSWSCNFINQAITGKDPLLKQLGNYGGVTETMAIPNNSPAIGKGNATICAKAPVNGHDQRGAKRSIKTCDIGAYDAGY